MKPAIAIPLAALILTAGWYVSEDPTRVGPFFDFLNEYTNQIENTAPMVPLQENENWLVVVVDFLDAPETGFRNPQKALTLLEGTDGADDYIYQMSGGTSTLDVTVLSEVYHAQQQSGYWGADDGDVRDVGEEGSDGPAGLAASVIKNSLTGIDLAPFDLNDDGWVDRFLIIHTAPVQEDSGGSSAIWSHYGPLTEVVEVGEYKFDHYTIAGFDSGFGTTIHEMLHQMGAIDLYDVHGQGTGEDWNGLGDWDVMASGNWNGANGLTPALPSLATMDLIGLNRATEVSMNLPGGESQEYRLSPLSDGGNGLFLQISPSERVWMSYRADTGFDRELPGAGLLVTIQDDAVGDKEQNLVNTDPDNPWLYVLEADGDSGLLSGNDEGDEGDVFTPGDKFGAEGRIIVDHYGRVVPWSVEVLTTTDDEMVIQVLSEGKPQVEILPPHHPIQLLPHENMVVTVNSSIECDLVANLTSSDGRSVTLDVSPTLTAGILVERTLSWDSNGIPTTSGRLTGDFSCGSSPPVEVNIEFNTIGMRLKTEQFDGDVGYKGTSYSEVPLQFDGAGSQMWEVRIEGALSRIASTDATQSLGDGSIVNLTIEPNGLLVPGMVAKGEVVLRDPQGLEQSLAVTLTAEQFEQGGELVRFFSDAGNLIMVMAGLFAFSVLLSMTSTGKSAAQRIRDKGRKRATRKAASRGGRRGIQPSDTLQSPFNSEEPRRPESTPVSHDVSQNTVYHRMAEERFAEAERLARKLGITDTTAPRTAARRYPEGTPASLPDAETAITGPSRPTTQTKPPSGKTAPSQAKVSHNVDDLYGFDDIL